MALREQSLGIYSPYWSYAAINTMSVIDLCLEDKLKELEEEQRESLERSLTLFENLSSGYKSNLPNTDNFIKFNTMYSSSILDESVEILRLIGIPLATNIEAISKQLAQKYESYAQVIQEVLDTCSIEPEDKTFAKEVKTFFSKIIEVNESKTYERIFNDLT